jgi:hypothetical protein
MGYPRAETPMIDVHGAAVSGPTLPATAWRLYMERALEGVTNVDFPPPLTRARFAPWTRPYAYRLTASQ